MKPTIFIVEDDPAVRESLKLILEMKGCVVEESEDGGSLLSRGRYSDLACVIMDINLPGENGLQILKWLRDRAIGVSVLIMSARSDERLRHEAKAWRRRRSSKSRFTRARCSPSFPAFGMPPRFKTSE
jgi:two-component system response regulator FixJ